MKGCKALMAHRLSKEAKSLLCKMIAAANPTQYICERFAGLSSSDDDKLRRLIRELIEEGFINVPLWADNLPYHVSINSSAYVYNEEQSTYEPASSVTIINDNSIKIGDNNVIRKSHIGKMKGEETSSEKQPFHQRHPWITAIVASLIAGFILLFSFWGRIIAFLEGVF